LSRKLATTRPSAVTTLIDLAGERTAGALDDVSARRADEPLAAGAAHSLVNGAGFDRTGAGVAPRVGRNGDT
jgi:hypothetical protein